jgi:hypothetical protein
VPARGGEDLDLGALTQRQAVTLGLGLADPQDISAVQLEEALIPTARVQQSVSSTESETGSKTVPKRATMN